jgi:hypothetical protein
MQIHICQPAVNSVYDGTIKAKHSLNYYFFVQKINYVITIRLTCSSVHIIFISIKRSFIG